MSRQDVHSKADLEQSLEDMFDEVKKEIQKFLIPHMQELISINGTEIRWLSLRDIDDHFTGMSYEESMRSKNTFLVLMMLGN